MVNIIFCKIQIFQTGLVQYRRNANYEKKKKKTFTTSGLSDRKLKIWNKNSFTNMTLAKNGISTFDTMLFWKLEFIMWMKNVKCEQHTDENEAIELR